MREQQQQNEETAAGAGFIGRHINKTGEEALFTFERETPKSKRKMMDLDGYK